MPELLESYTFFMLYRDGEHDFQGTFKVYADGTAVMLDAQGNIKPETDPYGKSTPGPRFHRREDGKWVHSIHGSLLVGVGLQSYLEAAWKELQNRRPSTLRSVTVEHAGEIYTVFANQIATVPQPDSTKLKLGRFNAGEWRTYGSKELLNPDLTVALEEAWRGIR